MNCIRVGTVSSVDKDSRTARVNFADRADMISAPLKILSASSLITADITTGGNKWTVSEKYASADRNLGRGESYNKSPPDSIHAELASQGHSADITIYGWLPYIGQTVLCILIPHGGGDGFIIGGV